MKWSDVTLAITNEDGEIIHESLGTISGGVYVGVRSLLVALLEDELGYGEYITVED